MTNPDSSANVEASAAQIPVGPFKPTDIFDASIPFTPTTSVEDVARGIDKGSFRFPSFGVPPL